MNNCVRCGGTVSGASERWSTSGLVHDDVLRCWAELQERVTMAERVAEKQARTIDGLVAAVAQLKAHEHAAISDTEGGEYDTALGQPNSVRRERTVAKRYRPPPSSLMPMTEVAKQWVPGSVVHDDDTDGGEYAPPIVVDDEAKWVPAEYPLPRADVVDGRVLHDPSYRGR